MTPAVPPPPRPGLPAGLPVPDYDGGGLVNLMASVIEARGGRADYPPADLLPSKELSEVTNIVLLVVDGLGAEWLERHSPRGVLGTHLRGSLTSVFPPTTASAITTFLTGDAPQQHGLTGWFTYLRELGCVMTVLPGRPRYGGAAYAQAGINTRQLLAHRPFSERIKTRAITVSPAYIAHSDYNLAHLGRSELRTFETLDQMFRQALRALRSDDQPKYLYLYWPKLDSIGHELGIESRAARLHLAEIEASITDFLVAAAGSDTLVLVTADHGQIDTTGPDCIELDQYADLEACLTLPLCGEPRAAFCYVRPNRVDDFERYCREALGDRVELRLSRDLVELGLFGRGPAHPRLHERIGDYTLLMRGNSVLRDRLPSEKRYTQVGVHGGLSRAELLVPLCVLEA